MLIENERPRVFTVMTVGVNNGFCTNQLAVIKYTLFLFLVWYQMRSRRENPLPEQTARRSRGCIGACENLQPLLTFIRDRRERKLAGKSAAYSRVNDRNGASNKVFLKFQRNMSRSRTCRHQRSARSIMNSDSQTRRLPAHSCLVDWQLLLHEIHFHRLRYQGLAQTLTDAAPPP